MDKPLIIRKREFIQKLQEAVKESGLPAFLMAEPVQILLAELRGAEEQEFYNAT
jgi:hypothetical protein